MRLSDEQALVRLYSGCCDCDESAKRVYRLELNVVDMSAEVADMAEDSELDLRSVGLSRLERR
mgnify:CR=1 FL=1